MQNDRLVILSGPSGVGKDTVIDAWRKVDPDVERVIAYCTRPPREGEVDGVDYRFVSDEEFLRRVNSGEFLEHKKVADHCYATPIEQTERILSEGRIAVLKIDVQGAAEVLEKRPDAMTVFLLPPSMEELRRRLEGRGTDSTAVVMRRLLIAEHELVQARMYEHHIVNDNVDKVVKRLQELTAK